MNTTITNYNHKNKWNTWSPIQELRREMDHFLDDFWGAPIGAEVSARTWQPACDVVEDKDHYLLSVEMAGIPKDQIRIEVLDRQLIISGERKFEEKRKENGVMYSERRYGKFLRNFALPAGLDTDKIEANYEDGVLRVLIPKTEGEKPRQISIESGQGKGFFKKLIEQPIKAENKHLSS